MLGGGTFQSGFPPVVDDWDYGECVRPSQTLCAFVGVIAGRFKYRGVVVEDSD